MLRYIWCILLFISCSKTKTPKPNGYFRFDLPVKNYLLFNNPNCNYTFEYPSYGKLIPVDTITESCWYNLEIPQYNATIYLSYKKINNNLPALTEDTHKFLYKHSIKADAIEEQPFVNKEKNISGFLYDIGGNAASAVQFYLTDSTKNFLRGALYFYSPPNRDSLTPLINFFREDIKHLMESLEFN